MSKYESKFLQQRGSDLEQDMLGDTVKPPAIFVRDETPYLTFQDSVASIKANQPDSWGDPEDPNPIAANDLMFLVKENLNQSRIDAYIQDHRMRKIEFKYFKELLAMGKIKLWNAVKSHFDVLHGGDVLLTFSSPKLRREIQIRIDITSDPAKLIRENKAEYILFTQVPYAMLKTEEKKILIEPIVKAIADNLLSQLKEKSAA